VPSSITTYAAGRWLPILFGIGTTPTNYWVGMVLQPPGVNDDGSSVLAFEPQDSAYHRQVMSLGPSWWDANDNGTVSNHSDINFDVPNVGWGYLTHVILCDDEFLGNLYSWGALRNPQNVLQGVAPTIPAGSLILSMPTTS
jgi:hypothetical protein